MKQFILEVQEGCTDCEKCPFSINKSVYHICNYLNENGICDNYDFNSKFKAKKVDITFISTVKRPVMISTGTRNFR